MRVGLVKAPCSAMRRMSCRPLSPLIGSRAFAHEFHAVVVGRVVAGRDHDAAVHLARESREIDHFGAAEADVVHIDARIQQALLQRLAQQFARQANVAADDHALRLDEFGVRATDAVRDVFVQLFGDAATEVVGLEALDGNRCHFVVPSLP